MGLGAIAGMGLGLTGHAAVESQDVGATGQLDDDRIFGAVGIVVFGEFYPQAPGLELAAWR